MVELPSSKGDWKKSDDQFHQVTYFFLKCLDSPEIKKKKIKTVALVLFTGHWLDTPPLCKDILFRYKFSKKESSKTKLLHIVPRRTYSICYTWKQWKWKSGFWTTRRLLTTMRIRDTYVSILNHWRNFKSQQKSILTLPFLLWFPCQPKINVKDVRDYIIWILFIHPLYSLCVLSRLELRKNMQIETPARILN